MSHCFYKHVSNQTHQEKCAIFRLNNTDYCVLVKKPKFFHSKLLSKQAEVQYYHIHLVQKSEGFVESEISHSELLFHNTIEVYVGWLCNFKRIDMFAQHSILKKWHATKDHSTKSLNFWRFKVDFSSLGINEFDPPIEINLYRGMATDSSLSKLQPERILLFSLRSNFSLMF